MRFSSILCGVAALTGIAFASDDDVPVQKRALATIYRSCKTAKTVALTFDDGPYIFEPALQTVLAKNNVTATFFVNGKNWACIYDNARITAMRNLFKAKHEFGSHTWSHANLTKLDWDHIHNEMWKTEQALIRILGVNPALMRPPFGAYNNLVLSAASARNQSVILWDFDSGDSTGKTAAQSNTQYDKKLAQRPNNLLPLNHETYNSTVSTVIPHVISTWKAAGYKFTTVSQCLGIKPYQFTQAQGVKDSTWHC